MLSGLLDRSPTPIITTGRLRLAAPKRRDYRDWSALRLKSRSFLQPWEPLWPEDDLTRSAFKRRLEKYSREARSGLHHVWFIKNHAGQLVGGISLTNIRLGVSQAGTLGYWIGEPYQNKGFMSEAAEALCSHVESHMGISRIEASTLFDNDRSIHLLNKLGFVREGIATQYLRINGVWQDHILFARTTRSQPIHNQDEFNA